MGLRSRKSAKQRREIKKSTPTSEDITFSAQTSQEGKIQLENDKKRKEKITQSLPHSAEAVIVRAIQKLETWVTDKMQNLIIMNARSPEELMNEIFDELRVMADFLRGKKLGEGDGLIHLIDDVVEMVQDLGEYATSLALTTRMEFTRDWVRETRMLMINSGVEPLLIKTDEEMVGLEDDVQVLLRRVISNENRHLKTFLVKGMPGIGKTSLARQVYNHAVITDRFKRRVWVSLSSDLTNKEVLVKLMLQVIGSEKLRRYSLFENLERSENGRLERMIRQHLQGMPYFVVVDNLLKQSVYMESVLNCLPEEDNGSILLVTSCSSECIKVVCPFGYVKTTNYTHEMKALDLDKSWQLFMKTIKKITSDQEKYEFPKHLVKKGKEMLMKACGGLPVAIIDVGRQKAEQILEKGVEWEELLGIDSIDWSALLELLESNYRKLDENLKACFMFVAFFKENTIIRAKKLGQIWVSLGGFGKRNVKPFMWALANESFFEIVDKGALNKIKNCRINPLLHRLSIKIAEQEMGLEILRNINGNNNVSNSHTSPCRHRVIHCSRDNKFNHYYSTVNEDKHLVSLIFHGGGAYLDNANWKRFEQLNMVDLEDFGLRVLSETIGTSLMELKYLGLRNNYIQEIPSSLGCLKKLEVLDICQNFMVEVPDIIWEMSSLQHLCMSDVICSKPLKIDMLEHLQTLAYIPIYDISSLETKMPSLRKLGIEEVDENSDVSKLFASLAKLEFIFHLTLRGLRFRSMPCLDEVGVLYDLRILKLDGLLAALPSADNFPPKTKELSLINSRLDKDPMPLLGKIPNLTHLRLQNAYTGREMVIYDNGFRKLEVLRIKELWNLRNLRFPRHGLEESSMWRPYKFIKMDLKKLEIGNCPYLDTLPKEIWLMKLLEEFKMVTTKKIATKMRKSGLIPKTIIVDISP